MKEMAMLAIGEELRSGLLKENYRFLTEESGKRCEELVNMYVQTTDSLYSTDIIFVKQLLKVATRSGIRENNSDFLKKLFMLHGDALSILENDEATIAYSEKPILKSHLLAHRGNIASKISANREGITWTKHWFYDMSMSGRIMEPIRPHEASRSYYSSGVAASIIAMNSQERREAVTWMAESYINIERALRTRGLEDKVTDAFFHERMADAARFLSTQSKNPYWKHAGKKHHEEMFKEMKCQN